METILGQGTFTTATGIPAKVIAVPQGTDSIRVTNYSQWGTNGAAASPFVGVQYFWQRGMPNGSALINYYGAANTAVLNATYQAAAIALGAGFTFFDPSGQDTSATPITSNAVVVSAVSNAVQPIASTTGTSGIAVGDVVRVYNTTNTVNFIGGIDWVVGAVSAGSSITLLTATNALATAPGNGAGAGAFVKVNYNPLFYPRYRSITNIVTATRVVSTSIAHGYFVGQKVRFKIPVVSGMTGLNSSAFNNYRTSTIVAVPDAYNFTIDTDLTGLGTFTSPTIAQQPSDWPQVIPVGEDTAYALTNTYQANSPAITLNANNILSDATINEGFIGVVLGTGGLYTGGAGTDVISGPAGFAAGNVMYWQAIKSSYVNI